MRQASCLVSCDEDTKLAMIHDATSFLFQTDKQRIWM